MRTRRIVLWIVSLGFGVGATLGTVFAFGSDFDRFWTNFLFKYDLPLLLTLGYGSLVFIWLDWMLRTEYLKN